MKLSNQALALKKAHSKGYSVTRSGMTLDNKGEIVETLTSKEGYEYFNYRIRRNGSSFYGQVYVHRLQGYMKYGDMVIDKKIHCRHLNGNKLDNSYDNIFIGEAADNRADFLRLTNGRRSKTITLIKKSFGRYQLLLKKKIVN